MWPSILSKISSAGADESVIAIDGSHLKAHQDACRHCSNPTDQGLGKTKGGRNSKINAVVDKNGKLLRMKIVPGNENDIVSAAEVLGNDLNGSIVLGDKAFQSADLAWHIMDAGGVPNIPSRDGTKDPLPYHKELGKLRRVVENFFCRIKRCRRVATRYEKLAVTFVSFVTLSAIDDWIRF